MRPIAFALAAPILLAAPSAHAVAVAEATTTTSLSLVGSAPIGLDILFGIGGFDVDDIARSPGDVAGFTVALDSDVDFIFIEAMTSATSPGPMGFARAFAAVNGFVRLENTTPDEIFVEFDYIGEADIFVSIDDPLLEFARARSFLDFTGFDSGGELAGDDFFPIDFDISPDAEFGTSVSANLQANLTLGVTVAPFSTSRLTYRTSAASVTGQVPLPAAAPLFLAALAGLGVAARRRKG